MRGYFDKGSNATYIALIPNKARADEMGGFW